jgi:AcrR family transcriptional regulator
MLETDTRTRLLDAAEHLFGTLGIAETSLRAITSEAGANLAAVNYHFGTKEALVEETYTRLLAPLNSKRLQMLDEAETEASPRPAPLERVVEAFVLPPLQLVHDPAHDGDSVLRLMGRLWMGPPDFVHRIVSQFDEVFRRFTVALGKSLPRMPREDLFWRLFFMLGSMTFPMMASHVIAHKTKGLCDPSDVEGLGERLVTFISGGLRAQPHSEKERPQ